MMRKVKLHKQLQTGVTSNQNISNLMMVVKSKVRMTDEVCQKTTPL